MAGVKGKTGKPGQSRTWAGPGRNPVTATLREGAIVMISQKWPDDSYADLGRGIVGKVEKIKGSADRRVVIPQKDGSELRIVIAGEK